MEDVAEFCRNSGRMLCGDQGFALAVLVSVKLTYGAAKARRPAEPISFGSMSTWRAY